MTSLRKEDVKFLESLREDAAFLFEHIIEEGKSESEALEMIKVIVSDGDLYLRKTEHITVPIRFKISWLKAHTNWSTMSYKEKDRLLWGIGMDSRNYKYEEGRLFCGENTVDGYRYNLVEYVYGQERLDKGWLELRKPVNNGTGYTYYSSEEARDYVWFRKHGRGAMMA